jgi:isopentenyl-diphosphate delta-isomerase
MLAAVRRTIEELGSAPKLLREAGSVTYQLTDKSSGLVEHEYNHLFIGLAPAELSPDPREVECTRYVTQAELQELTSKGELSMWFSTVWAGAAPFVGAVGISGGTEMWRMS